MIKKEDDPYPLKNYHLLVINSGSAKKKFIFQQLKKLGVKVTLVNKEKNWASSYIDHLILSDTNSHTETISKVIDYSKNHQIDGVITFWEDDVLLTSKIADRLNLIGIPYRVAKIARNKYKFREFCRENNLPAPKFRAISSFEQLKTVQDDLNFPMVIKPASGSSSAYVVKVEDDQELIDAYQYITTNISTTVESTLKEGKEIFVEEYIDGDEVDVDLILQNGKVKFISVSDNYITDEPFFIETTHAMPSALPVESQRKLEIMAEEILEKMGAQNGCIDIEAKITKNGPVPLEVNLRLGGDELYISAKKVFGVDMIEEAVKVALGIYITKKYEYEPKTYVMTNSIQSSYSGMISSMHIDKQELKKCRMEQLFVGKDIGDPILVPPEGYEYIGWVTVSGDNTLDSKDNLARAMKAISFDVVKFDEDSVIGQTKRRNQFSAANLKKNLVLGASKIEHLRAIPIKDQRKLKIGVACNSYEGDDGAVEGELANVGNTIQSALDGLGYQTTYIDFNRLPEAINILQNKKIDLVFNVCERINNSSLLEPHAAAILDAFQIPYTGSNPFTLGLCIDKIRVKKLLNYHNIPTPKWDYAYSMDDKIRDDFRYPLIVKPSNSDNSIGINNESVVTTPQELKKQLEKVIVEMKRPALIEEYIEGDEYDVSILGSEDDDLMVLPLARTIFDKLPEGHWNIYPFESKFGEGNFVDQYLTIQQPPKNVPSKLTSLISEIALDTYNILDCHDYGRVEVKVDSENNPYVLELNPNPSINKGNRVPLVAEMIGLDYPAFIEKIIALAIKRYKDRPPYYHLQTSLF